MWLAVTGLFALSGLVVWMLWCGVADVGWLVDFVGWGGMLHVGLGVYCGFLCCDWWFGGLVGCCVRYGWRFGYLVLVCAVVNCCLCLLLFSVVG